VTTSAVTTLTVTAESSSSSAAEDCIGGDPSSTAIPASLLVFSLSASAGIISSTVVVDSLVDSSSPSMEISPSS